MIRNRKFFLTLAVACATLFHVPAMAQTLSSDEAIAFAFFKAAGVNPDFDKWAKASDKYKTAAPAFADNILLEEKQALMMRWTQATSNAAPLEANMTITVNLNTTQDDKDNKQFWMNLDIPNESLFYLPYSYQDYHFAVMPKDLNKAAMQQIPEAQFNLIHSHLDNKATGEATLHILMMPVKAHIERPYEIDGLEQWALVTDVAGLSLKAKNGGVSLWDYTAPWYLSPTEQQVRTLFKKDKGDPAAAQSARP